jgi:hypothetical protein
MEAVKKDKKKNEEMKTTFLPMAFWSQIVQTMDAKSQSISDVYGFGKLTVTFVVFNGKVKDVVFNDEVRVRPEWDKPPLSDTPKP